MTALPPERRQNIATIKEAALRCGGVPALAKWLGVRVRPGDRVAHCPNAKGHAHGDQNPSLQLHPDGFKCHGCGQYGDALDLVVLTEGCELAEAQRIVASFTGIPYDPPMTPRRPRTAEAMPTRKTRPPKVEVDALWAASASVDSTPTDTNGVPVGEGSEPVSTHPTQLWPSLYLCERGFHAATLARLDVVRILPLRYRWPEWWPSTWAPFYRLGVLAYEPSGTSASIHVRAVRPYSQDGNRLDEPKPKTRWPKGCAASGLLFAGPTGLALLRGHPPTNLRGVLVVEGLTDLLRAVLLAEKRQRQGHTPLAVLGATSGGFKALADVRWPNGVHIYSATDADPAGARYHIEMSHTLAPLGIVPRRLDWTKTEASHG